jgi:transcriptional regulator with XRE-family HTH domain
MGEVHSLAQRLKAKRLERGLSQSQAARELEVARTAYRLWELEAARPAPDRWRLVARWLGVSMTTLLLSEGLMSQSEADASSMSDARYEAVVGQSVDAAMDEEAGGFFEQGRAFMDHARARGRFSEAEAQLFLEMLARIEDEIGPQTSTASRGPDGA